MAQNDLLKRYLDAGLAFTALTQARAEALVKDLVKAGEVQADQARDAVADLLERSRANSEKLIETIRTEVRQQITNLGLASQADLDRIEERIAALLGSAGRPAKRAAAPAPRAASQASSTARKATKRATKKASGAKKTATRKTAAKKAAGTRAPAKRSTKKSTKRA